MVYRTVTEIYAKTVRNYKSNDYFVRLPKTCSNCKIIGQALLNIVTTPIQDNFLGSQKWCFPQSPPVPQVQPLLTE